MALGWNPKDFMPSLVNQQTYDINQVTTQPPARTANAVAAVSPQFDPSMLTSAGYQAQVRRSERGEYNPAAPSVAGLPSGTIGSVSPKGTPYTSQVVGDGISRVNARGQSPLFTNLEPGAGLDDINRKGPMLASAREFLKGVPEFGQGYRGPLGTQQAGGGVQPQIDPAVMSLLSSSSLVDNWRGRMLQRAQARQGAMRAASQNAQSQALSAQAQMQNVQQEVPLAMLRDATTRRGQDFGLLPELPKFQRETMVNNSITKGDYDTAGRVATIAAPRVGNPPKGYSVSGDATIGISVLNQDTGGFEFYGVDALKAMQEQRMKQAISKQLSGAK